MPLTQMRNIKYILFSAFLSTGILTMNSEYIVGVIQDSDCFINLSICQLRINCRSLI